MKLTKKVKFKKPVSFDELLQKDPFGLLNDVGEKRLSMSVSDKIKESFEDVAEFLKNKHRLPSIEADDFNEELLAEKYYSLIKGFPEDKAYCESFLKENKYKKFFEGSHIFSQEKKKEGIDLE